MEIALFKNRGVDKLQTIKTIWYRKWKGKNPHILLLSLAIITAIVMAIPLIYVLIKGLFADSETWSQIISTSLQGLLWNTIKLTVLTSISSILLGLILAWLVERTDLPLVKWWKWLLVTPLVIPPYIGAFAYISFIGPAGILPKKISELVNIPYYELSIPSIYSFTGVWLIMTIFTYPYVFLMVRTGFSKMNANLEESARLSGLNSFQVFWKLILPLLRPSIAAGGLLVSLYVLSDFGAIGMLRYSTFTYAIYNQLVGRFNHSGAAILSFVLIIITVIIIGLEWYTRGKMKYYQTVGTYRRPKVIQLNKWRWPLFIFVLIIFLLAVVIPIGVLIYWSIEGIKAGAISTKFLSYLWNTFSSAFIAATITVMLALPLAYLRSRYPSKLSNNLVRIAYSGYALPGIVVALGLIFLFNQYIPWLYGTLFVLVLAFVIRFLPQAMQAQESALTQISVNIDEASRSMGYNSFKTLIKITLPLIKPGILTGWTLVFISSAKELPATMILRPIGFETLSFRVWVEAGEGFYDMAAPAALILIIVSLIPIKILLAGKGNEIK